MHTYDDNDGNGGEAGENVRVQVDCSVFGSIAKPYRSLDD